jgi:hypothetical protein
MSCLRINLPDQRTVGVWANAIAPFSGCCSPVACEATTGPALPANAVHHGTMCTFDACIAAPHPPGLRCPSIRVPKVSRVCYRTPFGPMSICSTIHDGTHSASEELGAMVVGNSWGLYKLDTDLPLGDQLVVAPSRLQFVRRRNAHGIGGLHLLVAVLLARIATTACFSPGSSLFTASLNWG